MTLSKRAIKLFPLNNKKIGFFHSISKPEIQTSTYFDLKGITTLPQNLSLCVKAL